METNNISHQFFLFQWDIDIERAKLQIVLQTQISRIDNCSKWETIFSRIRQGYKSKLFNVLPVPMGHRHRVSCALMTQHNIVVYDSKLMMIRPKRGFGIRIPKKMHYISGSLHI